MNILALEFSSPRRSVALAGGDGRVLASVAEDHRKKSGVALVAEALQAAALAPERVGLIAVGLGPGSYAGVRSAIAIAQGWQLARNTPAVGIGSLECLAGEALEAGLRGDWNLIVDAQRGDVYLGAYSIGDLAAAPLADLRIAPIASLPRGASFLGPEASRFVPGARELAPSAATLARLAIGRAGIPAENLEPIYLRETSFVKAPPPRVY